MQEKIYQLMKELVAIESVSCVRGEVEAAQFIYDYFMDMPYFKANPGHAGLYKIKGDPHDRFVPYAFIRGNSPKTVVIMGHFDVVGTEDYGEAEPLAFTIGEELERALAAKDLDAEARVDMDSGEWIWGRGVADMKGGLAVNMVLAEGFAERALAGDLPGSLFFMGVPDEESYSSGMRAGVTLLSEFKEKENLDLRLLIDPEPNTVTDEGAQVINIGSVGKTLPVVMVQGVTAHVGARFDGISPLAILTRIELATDESLEFTDSYQSEATLPPSWANLRDRKEVYDASIPYRAAGYMTVLSFTSTPDEILEKLRSISEKAFREAVAALDALYQEYKKLDSSETKERIYYEPLVMTFGELCSKLKEERGGAFDDFYRAAYADISEKIADGSVNYPGGTVELMEKVLNFADIKQPLVLLGFAPPYYPAVHSDMIPGCEGAGTAVFKRLEALSTELFGQDLVPENYAMGISDLSYCAVNRPFDTDAYSDNTPIWGDLYSIDFEGIANLNVPNILYGPTYKNPHQWTERVNKKSLLEVVPAVTARIIEEQWEG
jgi:arginine utilization protein RocB